MELHPTLALADPLQAAMDAERVRNLRWLTWLRVGSAVAACAMQLYNAFLRSSTYTALARDQLPLQAANIVVGHAVVASQATRDRAGDGYTWTALPDASVRGKSAPIAIFAPACASPGSAGARSTASAVRSM